MLFGCDTFASVTAEQHSGRHCAYDAGMKNQHIATLLFAPLLAASAAAQTLNWDTVQQTLPGTLVLVMTTQRTICSFQKTTETQLFCRFHSTDSHHPTPDADLSFNRTDIRYVLTGEAFKAETYDYSKGFLGLILAAQGGGGLDSEHRPTSFAGIKVGGPISVDLQYDRIQAHNGFSVEGSPVLPVFRVPRFRFDRESTFLKVYAEPGLGYQAGDSPFGGYTSAKVMAVLLTDTWSDNWVAPYVEIQRRFPFESPLQGDTRLAFGFMLALCEHCGAD